MTLSLLDPPPDEQPADTTLAPPDGWPAPPDPAVCHELLGEIVKTIADLLHEPWVVSPAWE